MWVFLIPDPDRRFHCVSTLGGPTGGVRAANAPPRTPHGIASQGGVQSLVDICRAGSAVTCSGQRARAGCGGVVALVSVDTHRQTHSTAVG